MSDRRESGVPREHDASVGKFPESAGVQLAAQEGSDRYYFRNPTGGISSIPAMDAEQARELLADRVRGFCPDDFEQVDGFDADPWEYPDPAGSDREFNEHDVWMLRVGMWRCRYKPRCNPTDRMIEAVLDEWNDPAEIPLHSREALQQADGVGPASASRIVGAARASNLIQSARRTDE